MSDDIEEILSKPDSVVLVEHEISEALREQGARPSVYPRLTDKTKQAIEAYISKRERLARIDELEKIEIGGDNIWTVDSGKDMAMLISERISELKKLNLGDK